MVIFYYICCISNIHNKRILHVFPGVGEEGEQLDRFMSSRFDLVEENLQKAAQKSSRLALVKSQNE